MNMPPKNMISVSRNSHIPKLALSTCCVHRREMVDQVRRMLVPVRAFPRDRLQ